jgi:uncharacterized protein (TIGR02466 family)
MITNLFSTPVYVHIPKFEEIFLVQQEIKNTIPEIFAKDSFGKPEGWEEDITTNINHRWNTIKDYKLLNLESYITKHVYQYINQVQPSLYKEVFLAHSWVNITKKNQSQEWHAHTDSYISGVYYYQTNSKDGNLMIKNPVPFSQKGLFPAGANVREQEHFTPSPGTLILFPGWLDHRVGVNTTDEERVTVAFNWLTINEEKRGLVHEKTH